MKIDHLINGKSVASRDYFETVNPATQEVLAEVASGSEVEVHAAVAAAKAAFPKWAATPAPQRAKLIRKLGDLIAAHVPEIAQIETNDCGQVIAQTGKQLVPRAADNFYYFAEMCTRVDGHTYPTDTHLNYTLFHPVGVCALVSPWNVPFMTATWKVAPCLAFGNTAVLKMSELSPMSAARLGQLALEAGIPPGVLNLVHGDGRQAGEPLVKHPDVRAISFTGSTATGNRIVKEAGLKKFSMELGGKSPFVVFEDADLERALDAAVFMIFSNNGERCTAGSRILVQQSIYADFAKKFAERAKRITVGDPLDDKTIVGPMISPAHLAKVRSYIELGPKEGATLLCGGLDAPLLPDRVKQGNYVLPTVFADVDNRMRIAQEEIFGPVLVVIAHDGDDDAVRIANDSAYGLSGSVDSASL
ncbi:MAG: aldehyde dehydrogenase family protein, partial [Rhizobacter sp.]|nr:aldehyde dehydrogenase family protein [Rhizobacter sp.]